MILQAFTILQVILQVLTNFTRLVNVSFASICDEKSAYGRLMNLLSTLEQIKTKSVSPVEIGIEITRLSSNF